MKIKLIDYIAGYVYQHWGVRDTDKNANIKWGDLPEFRKVTYQAWVEEYVIKPMIACVRDWEATTSLEKRREIIDLGIIHDWVKILLTQGEVESI